jgi:hypothetical protein
MVQQTLTISADLYNRLMAESQLQRMAAKYGMTPDSAELIREDRER